VTLKYFVFSASFYFLAVTQVWSADNQRSGSGATAEEWRFIVSGDSRNCGDLIMPAIAADAVQFKPAFYWHLGDIRAIYEMDEDYAGELGPDGSLRLWDMDKYVLGAWDDFEQMQIKPFDQNDIPFVLGIGNHETIKPKTREQFVSRFSEWLGDPSQREQRHNSDSAQAYYSWVKDGIDFIYLDNSTSEQFDPTQMKWLYARLKEAESNAAITAIIVGMHKALPNSRSNFHSMSESPEGTQSGRCVYKRLAELQSHKPVYVLSSHSHFVMTDLYNTPFWNNVGNVPGFLVGTAGAVRYRLPEKMPDGHEDAADCINDGLRFCAQTDVYGYLVATVNAKGKRGAIEFRFRQIQEQGLPATVRKSFAPDTINVCFHGNKQMGPSTDTTQTLPDGPCPIY